MKILFKILVYLELYFAKYYKNHILIEQLSEQLLY
jgi:hypothetical protein